MPPKDPITPTVDQDTEQTTKTNKPGLRIMGKRLPYAVIKEKRLSYMHMAAFALFFAVIGTSLVLFSHAAPSIVASVEAENMTLPAGTSITSDGKAILMATNGVATSAAPVSFAAVSNQITVRAQGVQCNGAPQMVVRVDNNPVLTSTVSSTSWTDYSTPVNLTAGVHMVSVSFTNDYTKYKGKGNLVCSRDLNVDSLTFLGANGDTSAPTAALLTATAGDQQAVLSWTAATDNVSVTRYEVWKDNNYVTGLLGTVRNYTASGLTNGVPSNFRVVAYDDAGNYTNSNTVSVTPMAATTPVSAGCPSGVVPAAFPSRLKTSGRTIIDENGCVMPKLKGFSVYLAPGYTHSQTDFNDMAALGAKINRATIHWDQFEPTQGVIDPSAISSLDQHIAFAENAHMYTMLELHLNIGKDPSWTSAYPTELEKYSHYGQTITQYLANRYGNPASPHYTKSVVGFGLNEPPIEDNTIRNGNNAIPYVEGKQQQMISWMRGAGYAPSWIGFVAEAYAGATPIYDHSWQNANATDASPTAYNAVGGNVIYDLHDYMMGCAIPGTATLSTNPNCDGRQYNGQNYPIYQGGPQIGTDKNAFSYASTAVTRSQLFAYIKPYKTFTTQANVPLMVGEWGWTAGKTDELTYVADQKAAWADAGTSIEMYWDFNSTTDTGVDPWAAHPGGTWRPSVTAWMSP